MLYIFDYVMQKTVLLLSSFLVLFYLLTFVKLYLVVFSLGSGINFLILLQY